MRRGVRKGNQIAQNW